MSSNVVSLDISNTVGDAAALMTEKRVGSIIVTKLGRPFGIITERDLVRGLAKREEVYFRATLLESFASHPLITTKPTTTVEEAAEVMFKNKIRRLPIVNESHSKSTHSLIAFSLFPAATSLLPAVISVFPSVFGCYPLLPEGSYRARATHPHMYFRKII